MAEYELVWSEALNILQKILPAFNFKTFFLHAQPFFEDNGRYYFEVNSDGEKNLMEKKYMADVQQAIIEACNILGVSSDGVSVIYLSPREASEFRENFTRRRAEHDVPVSSVAPAPEVYAEPISEPADDAANSPASDPDDLMAAGITAGSGAHEEYQTFVPPAPQPQQSEHMAPQSSPEPASSPADVPPARDLSFVPAAPASSAPSAVARSAPAPEMQLQLDPAHTFSSFVVGESNQFANAAAVAVANSPGRVYNPLFLYGGVGLGKTHLMHAIGNDILQKDPQKKIVYVTSETFTNELIFMIRSANSADRRQEFRNKYRKADILMIDDIQFIAGKDTTQDEFFHTFNDLHEQHKQIVISSDRPPKELNQLEERMRSRFEMGLIADIQPPDYGTRVAILQKKASERPDMLPFDNDVFHYIAEQPNANIRSLEGALTRVNMYARLHNASVIDVNTAKSALQEIFRSKQQRTITAQQVCDVVCEYFNVSEQELKGPRRTKDVAFARQVAMYALRHLTDLSLAKIAEFFGKKDHTTVMHAEKTVEKSMTENANVKREVDDVLAKLRNA